MSKAPSRSGRRRPAAPATLTPEASSLWRELVAEYDFDDRVGRMLLEEGLIAWDRARSAAALIARDGAVLVGRDGAMRRHPAVGIERDSRAQFVRIMRELGVNLEPVGGTGRPAGR